MADVRGRPRGGGRGGGGGGRGGGRGGGGRGQRRDGDEGNRGMGYNRLRDLSEKEGKELLNIVANAQSGFYDLLCSKTLKADWIKLIMQVAAKACRHAEQPITGYSGLSAHSGKMDVMRTPSALLMTFLNLMRTSEFFAKHLLMFISASLTETSGHRRRQFPETAKDILVVCKMKLQVMPNNVLHVIPVLSTLDMVVNMLRTSGSIDEDPELETLLKDVSTLNEDVMKMTTKGRDEAGNTSSTSDDRPHREREPPNNFRELSVFPTSGDMSSRGAYLRRNKVIGAYDNVEQYLDIHFRLLREDFMQPLREGISQYLEVVNTPTDRQKRSNVRIYQNVHILHPVCTSDGIAYRVQFDTKRLKKVRWEATKRLIYGSMVCISSDSFNSTYFATVSSRSPDELKQGIVELQFQNGTEEVRNFHVNQKLVMAESPAYFEAYRHVLQGLQITEEANFPFSQYFIQCSTKIQPPRYLVEQDEAPRYDFRSLVDEKFTIDQEVKEDYGLFYESEPEDEDIAQDKQTEILESARAIPVLNRSKWPSAETLKLDQSQLNALRNALTRELAIIQGPPGTGKTYLGLKIVRVLLQNLHFWKTDEDSPILLICYTNHALDQFLEGICKFQRRGIVRVGGRSKSKILEKFYLRELRKELRERKDIPVDVHRARMDAMDEMDRVKAEIQKNVADLEATKKGVVSEESLEEHMEQNHFQQLLEAKRTRPGRANDTVFLQWLGLRDGSAVQLYDHLVRQREAETKENADAADENKEDAANKDTNDEEGDVGGNVGVDANIVEDQRMIQGMDDVDLRQDVRRERKILEAALKRLAVQFADIDIGAHPNKKKKKNAVDDKVKIQSLLAETTEMTDDELGQIVDVRNIGLQYRWKIYCCWIQRYKEHINQELRGLENQYELAARRLIEVKKQEDMEVMKKATILGMTTTGAARYRDVLQEIQPKLVIVEEAAEVMEAHIITALSPGCEHLILIGDHQQLRPNPTVYKLAETYKLKVSLFERLIMNKLQYETLELQHRMRPSIAGLLQHIYKKLTNHESVLHYEDIKGVQQNLYFIDHEHEETHSEDLQSKSNNHEAYFLTALSKYLLLQGYLPSQITILTPYTGQVRKIREIIKKKHVGDIRCCAIDNYQGEENDIILLSLVRSNPEGLIGFLKEDNRICVSLSRAKKGMFIMGNASILGSVSKMWSKMIGSMRQHGHFGKALPLYCQNHPNGNQIAAVNAEDFEQAPEGGCLEPCGKRLQCGHTCLRMCHTYDRHHQEYKCRKTCNKPLCPRNHRCKKLCFEECGRCQIVERKTLACGHTQSIPCYEPVYMFNCKAQCDQKLNCGHRCVNACGQPHTKVCEVKVIRTLPCGHNAEMLCSGNVETISCPVDCGNLLDCEHQCNGTCGNCLGGIIHEPCSHDCGRTLVCGHQCEAPCTKNCPPCAKPCENRCAHSRCQERCGDLCVPCIEPCAWRCQHYQCSKLCCEPCDRKRCDLPCEETLLCGHQCIGLCGEPCPNKCRVCHKDDVQEIFFGNEDEDDTCFVQLEDCGHLIEVGGLDQWMDMAQDQTTAKSHIALKACPKCKTPIRRNLRYGQLIKALLTDIEIVKKKILNKAEDPASFRERIQTDLENLGTLDRPAQQTLERRLDQRVHVLTEEEIVCIENLINFLTSLGKANDDLKTNKEVLEDGTLKSKLNSLQKTAERLHKWLLKDRQKLSDQETKEAGNEVSRAQLLTRAILYKFQMNRKSVKLPYVVDARFHHVFNSLTSKKPFKEEEEVRTTLKEVDKLIPKTGLGISEDERTMIVKAMGLSQGHWFKCPQGHVYAIGDCGGAVSDGTCPECKARIGGLSYRLDGGNAVANEMDGATRGAYPGGLH